MNFEFLKDLLLWLVYMDDQLLLFVNSLHNPFFDTVMWCISSRWLWVPFYLMLVYFLFRRFSWKYGVVCLLAIGLLIFAADQTCASLIRPEICRLRPSNIGNPLSPFVHIVNGYRGGSYGFPSCHAANVFALAVFLSLVFHDRRFTFSLFAWAILVSYSRMYLGVHYFGDLFCGAIVGSMYAVLIYYVLKKGCERINV